MNVPLLTPLLHLIEDMLKSDGPVIAKAAEAAAISGAEQDPKVQEVQAASAALLLAAQNLKAILNTPPPPPPPAPETKTAA